MTISTTDNQESYTGTGVGTSYFFHYPFFSLSDLKVYKTDLNNATTTLVLNTDYTIAATKINGRYDNGTVVLSTALPLNYRLTIVRDVPYTQTTLDLAESGVVPLTPLEVTVDRLTVLIQQIKSGLSKALRASDYTASTDLTLNPQANVVLGFDENLQFKNYPFSELSLELSDSVATNVAANRAAILEVTAAAGLGSAIVGNLYEAIVALYTAAINASAAALTILINANTTAIDNLIKVRACVNFDRTLLTSDIVAPYTQTGTQVTVTLANHGHRIGHYVFCRITTGGTAVGGFIITAVTVHTFTYTSTSSLSTTGNVTLARKLIRSSKNVHSVYGTNSVGVTYINFTTALADANYTTQYTCGNTGFVIANFGDGSVVGQDANFVALYSYNVSGSAAYDFPYNAVTIVQ